MELDNNPKDDFIDSFSKPKIAWGNLALKAQFAFIEDEYFINAPAPFFTTNDIYLVGILNTKLCDYYIKSLGVTRNGGYFEYKPMYIKELPIPFLQDEVKMQIHELVKMIHINKNKLENTESIEMDLDRLIYKCYNLSQSEIEFIESL